MLFVVYARRKVPVLPLLSRMKMRSAISASSWAHVCMHVCHRPTDLVRKLLLVGIYIHYIQRSFIAETPFRYGCFQNDSDPRARGGRGPRTGPATSVPRLACCCYYYCYFSLLLVLLTITTITTRITTLTITVMRLCVISIITITSDVRALMRRRSSARSSSVPPAPAGPVRRV